jgi:hypothetical protein
MEEQLITKVDNIARLYQLALVLSLAHTFAQRPCCYHWGQQFKIWNDCNLQGYEYDSNFRENPVLGSHSLRK